MQRSTGLPKRDAGYPSELPDKAALKDALADEVKQLGKLQDRLMASKQNAVLVILQGRDASGKDGTIKQVFDGCNPQGCRVTAFGAATCAIHQRVRRGEELLTDGEVSVAFLTQQGRPQRQPRPWNDIFSRLMTGEDINP